MAWQDQGRQEHGRFGHGHGPTALGSDSPGDRAELRARSFAAFEFAMDRLRGEPGQDSLPHRATRDALRDLLPRWAEDATAPPNAFRLHNFGHDADPVDAWAMQRATLAVMVADTHAGLKDAGAELAHAMRTVGLPQMPGFLRAAQQQALLGKLAKPSPIQQIADKTLEEEEEEKAEEHFVPKLSLPGLPHLPTIEELPGGVPLGPKIGAAAVFPEDRKSIAAIGSPHAPTRGQQAERYYGESLRSDHPGQRSYLAGKEVIYGTPGSVRPDFVSPDGKTASFEVKSYDITAHSPSKLVSAVAKQALERAKNLPKGMTQNAAIDITGQTVTQEKRDAIKDAIVKRSGGTIAADNIRFFEREVGK